MWWMAGERMACQHTLSVVKGYGAMCGFALLTAARKDDLPALGKPTCKREVQGGGSRMRAGAGWGAGGLMGAGGSEGADGSRGRTSPKSAMIRSSSSKKDSSPRSPTVR